MENTAIHLKILLPFKIFLEVSDVQRIVVETSGGLFGMYPQRLDCVAALVPGIFTYETDKGIQYLALDEGVLIKAGSNITLSVRNAIGGADLGKLHESVEKEFKNMDEVEKNVRTVAAKLESGFIHRLAQFEKE